MKPSQIKRIEKKAFKLREEFYGALVRNEKTGNTIGYSIEREKLHNLASTMSSIKKGQYDTKQRPTSC